MLLSIKFKTFIKNFSNLYDDNISSFLERLEKDNISIPMCYRVPIKIELRMYSSWIASRQSENKQCDLVTYISTLIGDISSYKFDNETLRLYFAKYSWAFFFDGLDEVPESSNRKDVMKEIENFINIDLKQADSDAIFYATTRPEGYVGEFNATKFLHLDLLPLNKEECFLYLNKLLIAIENDSAKRKDYLQILQQGWVNKQIAFMMQTPLQATIITILVRAGGEPPRDKYSLFKDYFEIIIKREKQKCMGTILNDNQELIKKIQNKTNIIALNELEKDNFNLTDLKNRISYYRKKGTRVGLFSSELQCAVELPDILLKYNKSHFPLPVKGKQK